jgi:hypothetical protein
MGVICQGKEPKEEHKARKQAKAKISITNGSPYHLTCAHKKKK